jgi:uncharacterized protein (DUF2236 family)
MFDLDSYLGWKVDFSSPRGAPAFTGPDSVSWRVFKNPIALGVGGVAAVLLEFADARVRTGVWEHSTYKADPLGRSRRTAMAAMIGVYGPQDAARRVIQGVTHMHARVAGRTPGGEAYRALDPELLDWVSATAAYGFLNAYHRFVAPLTEAEQRAFYAEGEPLARLYGVRTVNRSNADFAAMLARLLPRFEPHPIIHEFLAIVASRRGALALPRILTQAMTRGAVALLPASVRARLELGAAYDLTPFSARALRTLGALADRIPIPGAPPADACNRLGLPADFLYRGRRAQARILQRWMPQAFAPAAAE